jgi:hypothetical protein
MGSASLARDFLVSLTHRFLWKCLTSRVSNDVARENATYIWPGTFQLISKREIQTANTPHAKIRSRSILNLGIDCP